MSELRLIISGGGTGGHIFPAIAIANAIKSLRADAEILFVGASGKMEMEKVPEAGYEIVGLPIRGVQRKLVLSNFKVPFLLIKSLIKSYSTIKKFKPDVVIGVGGYASAAVVYTAGIMGIKTAIQEQNSYPGITNKLLAKKANIIFTAFEGMEKFFSTEKIKLLGNPIRQDILTKAGEKEKALEFFKLDNTKTTLLAIGGSLGARTINKCVEKILPLTESHPFQIIWQCGKSAYDELKLRTDLTDNQNIKLFQFIREMDLAYAASDLIISRAGALSISEISALGKVSVLIPSPNVAEDHQTKNAMALTDSGAAVMLSDIAAEENIHEIIKDLLENKGKVLKIKENLNKIFSSKSAAFDIANEIIKLKEVI